MKILLTNDDGITSVGLHRLAQAMRSHGDVTIVAPDKEYSGAGAAIGAVWEFDPVAVRHQIDGIDEAWSLNGAPALCVLYAQLGLFSDEPFDLVVSGINPGANVGRSIYHSGTVGACLTARNGGISGVAVSQMLPDSYEGQAISDVIDQHIWDTAAVVASEFVGGLIADGLPPEPLVANINVPNLDIAEVKGWRTTTIGAMPPGTITDAKLVPTDDPNTFGVALDWGPTGAHNPAGSDGATLTDGYVSVSYLSRLLAIDRPEIDQASRRLTDLLG